MKPQAPPARIGGRKSDQRVEIGCRDAHATQDVPARQLEDGLVQPLVLFLFDILTEPGRVAIREPKPLVPAKMSLGKRGRSISPCRAYQSAQSIIGTPPL